ncbi:carboxypeptidase-like regulatory domain-containing protein [Algoriphagus sp.]|uniref:carboxypeptidase-like regulatory domain-containing protein n=1 Tax=Algoriphagus sp. TaxID=1872435 RepID=UPI00391977A0
MKHLFFIFLLFSFGSITAQTVSGVVREKGSGLPLPFANVFVNNTTQGIATDEEGRFTLSGNFPLEIELVASFMGFVTQVKTISFVENKEVEVFFELAFNESNLSEVELKAKRDKSWERNFRKFENVFLALPDDPYKSQIEILNPWVIEYEKINPEKEANYIRAYAKEPLLIKNEVLGYEIEYHLEDFRMLRTGSRFSGQVFFRSLNSSDSREQIKWEQARQSSYISSLRHLNQSILLNITDSVYFEMFRVVSGQLDRRRTNVFNLELNETIIPLENSSILRRPLGDKTFRIFLPDKIEIHHLEKKWGNDYYKDILTPISWIEAPDGYYDIDRNGVLIDPTKLMLSGYLARERVARALPLDFEVKSTLALSNEKSQVSNSKAEFQINKLREKVWLTTSKPYFYPGETAWIGGRVLYQDQFLADSLSRVLYVDILKANNEIVQSATFPILQGKISGALVLAQDLGPGDFGLRAYTHWNRNFPESDQFIAPFVVMEAGFIPEVTEAAKESFPRNIKVKSDAELSDSLNYRMMNLQLTFMDEFDNPIAAEFVLSISDVDQVTELTEGSSLEQAMDWLDKALPESFESGLNYPVEYGISIRGKYVPDNRRQPLITPITIVQGDLEDFGQVLPDSAGNFWATGLNFQDTAQIAIAAVNEKLRPIGSVKLNPIDKPNFNLTFPKLLYRKVTIPTEEYFLDTSGDYILLEEFVKEETRERETMAERNYGYGAPTQEVGPKELEKLTMEEILGLLRLNKNTAKFGNYNFGETVGAPLLIFDGSPRPYMQSGELLDFLLNSIEPSQLLSIKVYSDNISKAVFGMAGYAGVIMIETKKGFRINPEIKTKFNSEGFQFFPIPGITAFPEFPRNPPADQYLRKKPTIFWDPLAETTDGVFEVKIKVPYGIDRFRIKVEGRSLDGEVIFEIIEINK